METINRLKESEDQLSFKDIYDMTKDHIEKINWYINLYIVTASVVIGWLVTGNPDLTLGTLE